MAFGVGPAPHPSQRETARAGEARAAEVNMTNGVTNEVIAGRLQVVLGDVVRLQDPQSPGDQGGRSAGLWIRICLPLKATLSRGR